jgi:hypothetical protein
LIVQESGSENISRSAAILKEIPFDFIHVKSFHLIVLMINRFEELEEGKESESKKFGKNHNRHKGQAAKRADEQAEERRRIEQRDLERQQIYTRNHFSSNWHQSRHHFHEIEPRGRHENDENQGNRGNERNPGHQGNRETRETRPNRFVWHADSVSNQ